MDRALGSRGIRTAWAVVPLLVAVPRVGTAAEKPLPDLLVDLGRRGTAFARLRGLDVGRLELGVVGPAGRRAVQPEAKVLEGRIAGREARYRLRLAIPDTGATLAVEEQVRERTARNECAIRYHLRFDGDARVRGLSLSLALRAGTVGRRPIAIASAAGEEVIRIPETPGARTLARTWGRSVRLALPRGNALEIELDRATEILIRDDRPSEGDTVTVRFALLPGVTFARSGTEMLWRATLRAPRGLAMALEMERLRLRTDTRGWFAFPLPWDGAAADVSFLNDRPAGAHGFLTVRGDRFVFSDGAPARFWGVNLTGAACFPERAEAAVLARRLARYGVNLVRLGAFDATSETPNIFRFRPGGRRGTRAPDPESLDRLDGLIAALKREGIYVYLQLLDARAFSVGEDARAAALLGPGARPYANFDPALIASQKAYARALWTHRNPYTGLAYREDPAIVLSGLADENDLLRQPVVLEPYRGALEKRYGAWRRARGLVGAEADFLDPDGDLLAFFMDVQRAYYADMEAFTRGLGVRVPLTGSNGPRNLALVAAHEPVDFLDAHAYWNPPRRGDGAVRNDPMVRSEAPFFASLSFHRLSGKPFFASEWDEPWPNDWRAELPLWMAAVTALQGWGGAAAYTYRSGRGEPPPALGVPFEIARDPCRLALFYHAALLARRDVRPARERVAVVFDRDAPRRVPNPSVWSAPALHLLPEVHRVEVAIGGAPEGSRGIRPDESIVDESTGRIISDTGELARSRIEGWGSIDTPGTQAVYGLWGRKGWIELRDLAVEGRTLFAVLALSSLTGEPIRRSRRLLLTAVARAENTGLAFDFLRQRKLEDGTAPILLEPVEARIAIATEREGLAVHALGPRGEVLRALPVERAAGRMTFAIGPEDRTIHYRIEPGGAGAAPTVPDRSDRSEKEPACGGPRRPAPSPKFCSP